MPESREFEFTYTVDGSRRTGANSGNPNRDALYVLPSAYNGDEAAAYIRPFMKTDVGRDGVSLTESVYDYHKENGRTYHAYHAGSYYFPNDEMERERQEEQHHIFKIVLGGRNYLAPWSQAHPPTKVLDVATGTGLWAVEMGDEFPSAEVIGIDLSPIQPTLVPPNVNFYVEDANDDWQEEGLDYIHTRITAGSWADMNTAVVQKAFARLQPGGWLECQELREDVLCDDGSLAANAPLSVWIRDVVQASIEAERPLTGATQLTSWFRSAGFVDVHEQVFRLPLNRRAGVDVGASDDALTGRVADERVKLGELWQSNVQSGLSGFSYGLLHRILNRSKEEIEVSLVDVRRDLTNPAINAYAEFYVVWGRKP